MSVELDKPYSIGIGEIDDQHAIFFKILNDLNEAIQKHEEKQCINEIMERLIEYTEFHFKHEENYFEKFDYEDRERHCEQHRIFIKKLENFLPELEQKGHIREMALILYDELYSWFVNHILYVDLEYAKLFKEKGVS